MSSNDHPVWDAIGIVTIPRCRFPFCLSKRVEAVSLISDDEALYLRYRCQKCKRLWFTCRREIKGKWQRPMRLRG